jgi:DedD protein
MASPPITEQSEVRRRGRQRLIGAIALVAVLVVFVPMVLDSEPRKQPEGPALAIPSKTNAPPLPAPPKAEAKPATEPGKLAVEPAKPAAEPSKAAVAPASPPPARTTGTPAKTDPKVAEAKVLDPSKPPPPKAAPPAAAVVPPPSAAPKLEGFAVQVGAFRDEAKLDQARQKLSAAKVPHYTERLEAKAGPLTRLRAGPFPTREAAETALNTLKRLALEGKVVPLP